jgi:homoserine dehydrogenase
MKVKEMDDVDSMYYFRFSVLDRPGVLSKISGIFGECNISISSVIQKGRRAGETVPLVLLTHTAREKDVRRALREVDDLAFVTGKTAFIRVEGEES